MVKKAVFELILGLGLVASIITIVVSGPQVLYEVFSWKYWLLMYNSCAAHPVIIALSGAVIIFVLGGRENLAKRGSRGVPLRLSTFMRRMRPQLYSLTISGLHRFEHDMFLLLKHMEKHNYTERDIGLDEIRQKIGLLLEHTKELIEVLVGKEVSVHCKLFERIGDPKKSGTAELDISLLRTYERVPSYSEKKGMDKGGIRRRSYKELFKIVSGQDGVAEKLRVTHPPEENSVKVNSAYNYVFGENEHYWISNDLKKEVKEDTFYSTSAQYENYYNSMGVFLISPPIPSGIIVEKKVPYGLLIFDSLHTRIFDKQMMGALVGCLAHRFYEVFAAFRKGRTDGN